MQVSSINVAVKIVILLVALTIVGAIGTATTGFCPPAHGHCPRDTTVYKPNVLNLKSMIRYANHS